MKIATAAKPIFKDKKRRVWELDFLRGFAVLAMCFDHLMYDCSHPKDFFSNFKVGVNSFADGVYKFAVSYWKSTSDYGFRFWAHYLFVFLFLFLVGTSCAFSRNNTRRGALCGIAALVFTGATFVCKAIGFMEDGVVFGILDCIAMSILCTAALDSLTNLGAWITSPTPTKKQKAVVKAGEYINLYAPLVLGAVILFVGIFNQFWTIQFDRYFTDEHFLGYIFGKYAFGDDWFGLFPYLGAVLIGTYWGKAAYSTRASLLPALDGKWHKPVIFVGRHALIFYFLHQVVLAGLFILIGLCMGFSL
ncbi:MAG: DUF1624 domain-containing protein [Clostridiales bacterium]|nr:DUF1624 domain-containing protein [Clostridiales bacterium]